MTIISFKNSIVSSLLLCMVCISFTACNKLDIFEKNISIPNYQWAYSQQPQIDFTISDTAAFYKVFVVLRHTDAYRYNNIWVNIGTRFPGSSSFKYQRFDLKLGNDASGWEGTGMDDIWEVRKLITAGPVKFMQSGSYSFIISQAMRENPLPNIMSVGVRVERVK